MELPSSPAVSRNLHQDRAHQQLAQSALSPDTETSSICRYPNHEVMQRTATMIVEEFFIISRQEQKYLIRIGQDFEAGAAPPQRNRPSFGVRNLKLHRFHHLASNAARSEIGNHHPRRGTR